jgi:hypothetical protein
MAITSANQLELLQTAEAVAREKMIDPSLVVEAMEESLAATAAKWTSACPSTGKPERRHLHAFAP